MVQPEQEDPWLECDTNGISRRGWHKQFTNLPVDCRARVRIHFGQSGEYRSCLPISKNGRMPHALGSPIAWQDAP